MMQISKKDQMLYVALTSIFFVIALFPLITGGYLVYLLAQIFAFVGLAYSWNIISGYSGYISFGHHGFYGLAAFSACSLIAYQNMEPFIAILIGGLIAFTTSIPIGFPCLELRGPYFSIVTLAIAEALKSLIFNIIPRKQMEGIALPPAYTLPRVYWGTLVMAYIAFLTAYLIKNSHIGLALFAIRENEAAAQNLGVNTTRYKMFAFTISAFYTGIIGGLLGWNTSFLTPLHAFSSVTQINIMVMVLFGGIGTMVGPFVGSVIFTIISEYLWLQFPALYLSILGFLIVSIVRFLPGGLHEIRKLGI